MADPFRKMQKIWPIFRWANWWISDDLFTGIQNSYYYSNQIEIREDAKSIYPSDKPYQPYTLWTEEAKPVCMMKTANSWDNMFVFVWKSVYVIDTNDFSDTPELLCTFSDDICDAETFNWYIYISTTGGLYLIDEEANSTTWSNLPSETTVTWTPYHWRIKQWNRITQYHPLYATETILVCWDYEELIKILKETCDTYTTWFTLQEWVMIRLITELWGFMRIVVDDSMWGSAVVMRDKTWTAPNEIIPFDWYKFFQTCIYNWYQYLLSDKGLWILNWYQYYILKKAQEGSLTSHAHNAMCVFDDKIYFATSEGLYIYWAKNKNYNDVLSLWKEQKGCGCVYSDWINLYTSSWKRTGSPYSKCWWTNKWGYLSTSWEFQTMAYFGTSLSEIKQAVYLRVWYKIPQSSWTRTGKLKVFYRTEADAVDNNPDNWTRHELTPNWWLTKSSDMRSPFATTFKLNCRFQWIQFKFVLENCPLSWWWYLLTHLYSADLYYNAMLD